MMGRGEAAVSDFESLLNSNATFKRDHPDLRIKSNAEIERLVLERASSDDWKPNLPRAETHPYGVNIRGIGNSLSLCASPIFTAPSDRGFGEKLWRAHIGLTQNASGEWRYCSFTTHGRMLGEQTNTVSVSDSLSEVMKKVNAKIQSKIRPSARSTYSPKSGTGDISDDAKFELTSLCERLDEVTR